MCTECQFHIAANVIKTSDYPELSVAVRINEQNRRLKERDAAKAVAKIRRGDPSEGFVYYIRINGQIKIGYAADVTARMRHYPPGSELLAVEPGTLQLERERHIEFANDLERGREWFGESARLIRHMASVVELRGDPSKLAYQFTSKTG